MNSNFYISGNSDQGDIFQGTWKTLLEIMKLKFMFLIKCQAFVKKKKKKETTEDGCFE